MSPKKLVQLISLVTMLPLAGSALAGASGVRTIGTAFLGSGGVTVAPNGDILVGDFGPRLNQATGAVVHRFTPDGIRTTFASGLQGASGAAFDANGNLIQSNIRLAEIVRINPSGQFSTLSTGITAPIGVAINAQGEIFVASCSSNRIMKAVEGGPAVEFSSSPLLNCPNGLTVDDAGVLYAVNFNDANMIRIDQGGNASLFASIPGSSNGHVTFGNARFYVAGRGANQIFEVSLDGEVSVLAGSGQAGSADGAPDEASLYRPNGIRLSPDGRTLYVNQNANPANSGLHPNLLRAIDLVDDAPTAFTVRPELRGSWYNPDQSGQGFLFDFVPDASLMFAGWYTFQTSTELQDASGNDQRWFTALGVYVDDAVEMELYRTLGGRLASALPAADTQTIGSLEVTFLSCTEAVASYSIDDTGESGVIPLRKISLAPDCS